MALIVEDGTGLSNAESYTSVADASTRHTNLGNAAWAAAASDTVREQALRKATNYMEQAFRENWLGRRLHRLQALSWPRWDIVVDGYYVDPNSVPPEVAAACADLALAALSEDLNPDLTRGVKSEKIGPIETEYDSYSPQATRRVAVSMALAPFLKNTGANAQLVRA